LFEKFRETVILKNFHKKLTKLSEKIIRENLIKNTKTKNKKTIGLSTEKMKSFCLFFITFSILSIFGALEAALGSGIFLLKTTKLVCKTTKLVCKTTKLVCKTTFFLMRLLTLIPL